MSLKTPLKSCLDQHGTSVLHHQCGRLSSCKMLLCPVWLSLWVKEPVSVNVAFRQEQACQPFLMPRWLVPICTSFTNTPSAQTSCCVYVPCACTMGMCTCLLRNGALFCHPVVILSCSKPCVTKQRPHYRSNHTCCWQSYHQTSALMGKLQISQPTHHVIKSTVTGVVKTDL